MTRAATKLLISQPALSRQISDLETELGVKLFNRKTRHLTLTPDGQYLLGQAQKILGLTAKTKNDLQSTSFVSGDLTIAAGESSGMQPVMNVISSIIKDHPTVKIHLLSGDYHYTTQKLNSGDADFAIIIGDVPLNNYASLTLPQKDDWGVLMRPDDPLAQKSTIRPQDLVCRSVLNSQQAQTLQIFQNWLGNYSSCVNFIGTYNLYFNGTMMVKNHAALMFALDNLADTSQESGLVFKHLTPALGQSVKVAWKQEVSLSPVAELFIKRLKDTLFTSRSA
ncbi:transcriptional regulator [Lactobacillus xylocopicola]|uniref:Transcriptional regulator n=2 Tax=Lactobacillus xylocopicola TaxID=2976676 RepID=A0ABM8BF07_9LACO|nr:transcriptional regulator [Lactobacillus xylocopicola]